MSQELRTKLMLKAEDSGDAGFHLQLSEVVISLGFVVRSLDYEPIYVALDQKYIDKDEFNSFNSLTQETANLIGGLIRYLRSSGIKGIKFASSTNPKPKTTNHKLPTTNHKL